MAKKKEKDKRKRKRSKSRRSASPSCTSERSSSSDEDSARAAFQLRLLSCVVRNKEKRLRRLLDRSDASVNQPDSQGQTLLHKASICGHVECAKVLLRHGADSRIRDLQGNMPAHVAGLKGHLVLLSVLLQGASPPDIDGCVNSQGLSIRAIADAAMAKATGASATSPRHDHHPSPGDGDAAIAASKEEHEEEWQRRLREEDSGGEGDWGEGGDEAWGMPATSGLGHAGPSEETDDMWADRLWHEMQGRRRAAARAQAAAFFGAGRSKQAEEAAAAAAASRQREAERLLRKEQQKDAEWRRAAGRGAAEAAGPGIGPQLPAASVACSLLDHAALRVEYERKWAILDARATDAGAASAMPAAAAAAASSAGGLLHVKDVPWPLPEGSQHLREDLAEVLLWGAAGPAEIKKRLRAEIMRWHPDKFTARFGAWLAVADRQEVLQRVKHVSQQVTALMLGSRA